MKESNLKSCNSVCRCPHLLLPQNKHSSRSDVMSRCQSGPRASVFAPLVRLPCTPLLGPAHTDVLPAASAKVKRQLYPLKKLKYIKWYGCLTVNISYIYISLGILGLNPPFGKDILQTARQLNPPGSYYHKDFPALNPTAQHCITLPCCQDRMSMFHLNTQTLRLKWWILFFNITVYMVVIQSTFLAEVIMSLTTFQPTHTHGFIDGVLR